MQDAWRAYLELALGLTEASKKRAQTIARRLVGSSGATAAQLQTMAEELLSAGMANREALNKLVRAEVHRTLGAVGLASAEELDALRARVDGLERQLREVSGVGGPGRLPMPAGPGIASTGEHPPLATGPGEDHRSEQAVVLGGTAERATAMSQPVAKKTVAKKTVAKKTVAKKAVVKKTTGQPPQAQA